MGEGREIGGDFGRGRPLRIGWALVSFVLATGQSNIMGGEGGERGFRMLKKGGDTPSQIQPPSTLDSPEDPRFWNAH